MNLGLLIIASLHAVGKKPNTQVQPQYFVLNYHFDETITCASFL